MRVLIALERDPEAQILSAALEDLGHKTIVISDLADGAKLLHQLRPDLVVVDERPRRDQRQSGLRLAERCGLAADQNWGGITTQALVILRIPDWDEMRCARRKGVHVVVKGANFDATVRYIQVLADNLVTDRVLGPLLIGVHRFPGDLQNKFCGSCQWVRAYVSYGTSEADIDLTPVRTAILNALLRLRRGQSATEIAWVVNNSAFLQSIMKGRTLKEGSVKMEISRIREAIGIALDRMGSPYTGHHFLPSVAHSVERYRLAGSWNVLHTPVDSMSMLLGKPRSMETL